MKRKPEYRAWYNNEMYCHEQLVHNENTQRFPNFFDLFRNEEVIAMQSTGTKSNNWVKLFDWDIVKTKYQEKAILEWDEQNACFCTRTIDDIVKDEVQYCMKDIERVLWTIYENPELLTK